MVNKLPKNWKSVLLVDLLLPQKGKKPRKLSSTMFNESVPYLDIKAIEKGIVRNNADTKSSLIANKNDVLMVWDGARSGWVGTSVEGAVGSTLMRLTPILIVSKYVFYFLRSKFVFLNTQTKGIGIPHINQGIFWDIKIPLPPIQEQKRISTKLDKLLSKVDEAKEHLEKIPVILKRFRQSVLNAAVTGELTKEWRKKNLQDFVPEDFADQIKNEKLKLCKTPNDKLRMLQNFIYEIDIDNKWITIKAELVSDFITKGTTPKHLTAKGNIPYLKVYNIVNDKIDFNYKPQFVDKGTHTGFLKRSIVYPNDVLMNIVGPPLGKVAIVTDQFKEWNINQALAIFRPVKSLSSKFLYYIIKDGYPIIQTLLDTKGIVGQSNISLGQCRNLTFKVPPYSEQTEIVKRVESLFKSADEIDKRFKKAKTYVDKLTQSILAKAFSGELVPQNPKDQPVEKLLDKIELEKKKIEAKMKELKKSKAQG